jgi:hypothetical protein
MVLYTVMRGKGEYPAKLRLHVEGKVTLGDWEKLRERCLDALKNSDDFVLDLQKVSEYGFPVSFFVCLLRRTVRTLGKRVAIRGRKDEFVCLYSKTGIPCRSTGASNCCLCGDLFTRTAAP